MRKILLTLATLSTLAIAGAVAPSTSEAQARHALYAGALAGPYAYFDCCNVHFRIEGEFGWHPSGEESGFFLGGNVTTTFNDFVQLFGGLRLGGDIEVYGRRDVAFFLRPSALFGAGFQDWDGRDNTHGFFIIQPAFDLKIGFADRVFQVVLRPVAIDILMWPDHPHDGRRNDFGVNLAYSFMAGFHFAF